jgi:mxaC protein
VIAVDVVQPWMLALLPLAAVPVLLRERGRIGYSWLGLVPDDPPSRQLDLALRMIGALTIVSLVLGMSGLHRPEYEEERIGRGAHMVLLVDRSTSMDRPFAADGVVNRVAATGFESKGHVARRLLSEFVAERGNDLFGVVVFSTFPIPVLQLTANHRLVHAAIAAGNVGRGLAETDIGSGLERALEFFEDKPYTGSRIVVLVSDGAGELNQTTRLRISHLMRRLRVSLYWIYIRSAFGPRIFEQPDADRVAAPEPERALHEFFTNMDAPYQAYTAESPRALQQAIADVSRLQNLPLRDREVVGRRDLSQACFAAALAGLGLLLAAKVAELPRW